MAAEPERRRHSRGKRLLRFEYTKGGGTVRALSSNVSAGGAFLCANDLPAVGGEIQVRFVAGSDASRVVKIRSRVIRAVSEPSPTEPNRGIAVNWLEATTTGHPDAIKDFLDQFKDDPGGQILVPDDSDPDGRFRYIFPEPEPETPASLHDNDHGHGRTDGSAIPMGDGSGETRPGELSMRDFLIDDDDYDDDDDDGPPTQPVDAPPGALDELFADEADGEGAEPTMEEVSFELLAFDSDDASGVPGPLPLDFDDEILGPAPGPPPTPPAGRRPTGPPPTPPAGRRPTGPPPTPTPPAGRRPTGPPVAPQPAAPSPAAAPPAPEPEPLREALSTPKFTPRLEPDPTDEDIGSGLVPVDIPVTLEWSGNVLSARTTHLTETQMRMMVQGTPPAVYSRISVVFPPAGRKNKPMCTLRGNVTRVRKAAMGDGGLVTLRLAMQNEPSDLRAYRKIVKKAGKGKL